MLGLCWDTRSAALLRGPWPRSARQNGSSQTRLRGSAWIARLAWRISSLLWLGALTAANFHASGAVVAGLAPASVRRQKPAHGRPGGSIKCLVLREYGVFALAPQLLHSSPNSDEVVSNAQSQVVCSRRALAKFSCHSTRYAHP